MAETKVYALVDYEDTYVQPLILAALETRIPKGVLEILHTQSQIPTETSNTKLLQWRQYESLDLEQAIANPGTSLLNSYIIRKALIRKHYLSTTVSHWLTKHPESCLKHHVTPSVEFELDYSEFLDDALVEAYELREAFEKNAELEDEKKQWWILKPGMSDRGQGIRLFNSEEDLTGIFEQWDPESDDEDDEDAEHSGDDERVASEEKDEGNGVITSDLRHFVAQPYIHPPLLLPAPFPSADRKFHIRTYVLAVGALKVFVYKPMLALFAGKLYSPPWESESGDPNEELSSHLTNTCMQTGEREGSVHAFWSLPDDIPGLSKGWKDKVFEQICEVTGQMFEGAARGMMVHFQPLPNAFELFGVDFLVDASGNSWLLEVNAFPDFAQTGEELNHIVQGLFEEVVEVAVKPFFGLSTTEEQETKNERMIKALDIDLGRR